MSRIGEPVGRVKGKALSSPIQAVFVDFDGTLVDSEPLHYDCWMRTLHPYGGHVEWDDYVRRFVGVADFEAGRIMLREAGVTPSDADAREASHKKKAMYQARFVAELDIAQDICDWFTSNSGDGVILGVVSSSLTEEVEPLLFRHEIRSAIDVLVCGEHVSKRKPDPEPYHLALTLANRLAATGGAGKMRAQDCLVVEDSDSGAAAAHAAGMRLRRVGSPSQLVVTLAHELLSPAK